jgi:hypothetical protein
VPVVEKYRERLPHSLTVERDGLIEQLLLNLSRKVAPESAGGSAQSDEELFFGFVSVD